MRNPIQKKISDKNRSPISTILKKLMDECSIIEAELARQTGLPQTTVNRLLLSENHDPRANTLIPIARFFSITIGQLLGQEPINPNRISGTVNPTNRDAWSIIPIIEWQEARSWLFQKRKFTPSSHNDWITTEKDISQESFALKTLPSMEPRFRKNSTIIVDPHYQYHDGNYVIISIQNSDPTTRRVIKDGKDIYLSKLYGKEEPIRKKASDEILGTIIETRINENR